MIKVVVAISKNISDFKSETTFSPHLIESISNLFLPCIEKVKNS